MHKALFADEEKVESFNLVQPVEREILLCVLYGVLKGSTVEPRYNEVLGTMKLPCYIRFLVISG